MRAAGARAGAPVALSFGRRRGAPPLRPRAAPQAPQLQWRASAQMAPWPSRAVLVAVTDDRGLALAASDAQRGESAMNV